MSAASIDDFRKIELRTAKVLEVHEIPGADKIWRLLIDTGSERRQIVAGIKAHYTSEQLVGKSIVVVHNLAPATIRGVESCGMLLAAKDAGALAVITTDREMPAGSLVG